MSEHLKIFRERGNIMLRRIVFVWVIIVMPFVAQGTPPEFGSTGGGGWDIGSPSESDSERRIEIPSYTLKVEEYYSTTIKDIDRIDILITNVTTEEGRGVIDTATRFCGGGSIASQERLRAKYKEGEAKFAGRERFVEVVFTDGVVVKNIAEESRDIRNYSFSFDYVGKGWVVFHVKVGRNAVFDGRALIPIPFLKGESRVLYLAEEDVERLKSGKEIETKDEFERPGSITLGCHPRGEGVGGRKSSSDEVPEKFRFSREWEYWRSLKRNMLREQFHQEQKKYLEEKKKSK